MAKVNRWQKNKNPRHHRAAASGFLWPAAHWERLPSLRFWLAVKYRVNALGRISNTSRTKAERNFCAAIRTPAKCLHLDMFAHLVSRQIMTLCHCRPCERSRLVFPLHHEILATSAIRQQSGPAVTVGEFDRPQGHHLRSPGGVTRVALTRYWLAL